MQIKKIPIVSNALVENHVFPSITCDGYSGGYIVAEHLYKQGYKNGILKGPVERPEDRY